MIRVSTLTCTSRWISISEGEVAVLERKPPDVVHQHNASRGGMLGPKPIAMLWALVLRADTLPNIDEPVKAARHRLSCGLI